MWFLFPILSLFFLIAPLWAIVAVVRQRRELRALRERLEALEGRVGREGASLAAVPPPGVTTTPATPPPAPIPLPWTASPAREVTPASGMAAAPAPAAEPPATGAAISPREPAATIKAHAGRGFDSSRAEELIGSVWLQNVGAVLLLLGVFFLILWGYTTGRLGPGVLVWAGVALGITLAWRGDRMARSLPLFGHALIGVGLGTIYLSLYLGHFTLRVLPPAAAFAALTLVSVGSIAVGLRYRVQTIAALGVLGAFVPQLMAAWIPLKGFAMSASGLLGYLAAVDAVVFLLAARAGWSALGLACLFLSAVTWIAQFHEWSWGWGVQAGLTTLFTALGLSPLPRLSSEEGTVRGIDLAVIALAPLCLVAASWPLLVAAGRGSSAALLFALAVVYLLAALRVDARRPERDLWRPLTGAAVLFLTAALERAVGDQHTPMAWCVEGTLLVWLGLRARGEWLRRCGYAVSALGTLWVLATVYSPGAWQRDQLPIVYPAAIRDLVCILTVLSGAWLLARGRAHLSAAERRIPEIWAAAGNLMLLAWTGREAAHLALALEGEGGRWAHPRDLAAPRGDQRLNALTASLMGLLWMAQSAVLMGVGRRPGRGFLRTCGYAAGALAALVAFVGLNLPDGWSNDLLPILHPTGLLTLGTVALIAAMAAGIARRRERLGANERRMPETLTVAASLLMLGWTALEADHLARTISGIPGVWAPHAAGDGRANVERVGVLAASFTSAGWLVQALTLLALGWTRRSAFLRWTGLGLTGITVLKFVVVDLQTVDVFWRFLTAIVVGAALLGISYAYQRRTRG
jgi:uncharacterized membrane protein